MGPPNDNSLPPEEPPNPKEPLRSQWILPLNAAGRSCEGPNRLNAGIHWLSQWVLDCVISGITRQSKSNRRRTNGRCGRISVLAFACV